MTEAWVEHDAIPEGQLPEFARDGRHGDRVSLVEGGLLHVVNGRATFVRSADVLGVLSHAGRVYVLVPRRPPAQPWLTVTRELLGNDERDALERFAARVRELDGSTGYRDSVRRHRQGLGRKELEAEIVARRPVPGAMEVPSTVVLGRSYPGLGFAQGLTMLVLGGLGYVLAVVGAVATAGARNAEGLFILFSYVFPLAGLMGGAFAARAVGRAWRAAKDRTLPRQRVLVLAPDGCVVGFRSGVRTLTWSMVGSFGIERVEPNYDEGLVVFDPDGKKLGEVDAGYLDAPLGLVVAIAQAYRRAAA